MTRRSARHTKKRTDRLPLVAAMGVGLGFMGAYIGAESVLNSSVHPLHWLVAIAVGLLGYGMGMVWYWQRGDIA
jgi:uncharacterized membrane protein YfcA